MPPPPLCASVCAVIGLLVTSKIHAHLLNLSALVRAASHGTEYWRGLGRRSRPHAGGPGLGCRSRGTVGAIERRRPRVLQEAFSRLRRREPLLGGGLGAAPRF